MSIATTDNKATYQGNGVTTSWPFTFPVLEEGHLSVILTDPDGLETTLTSDYVVDLTNKVVTYPGYLAGQEPPVESQPPVLPSGSHITLLRVVPYTQDTDLGNRWPFNEIEAMVDRTTMQLQQLAEESSRSVKTSVSSTVTPDELLAEIRTGAATASTAASTATGAASTATTAAATATAAASAASADAATAGTAASTATGAASTATTAAATATAAASAASTDAATASTAASTATGAASTATTGAATATTKAGEAAESAAIALANSGAVLLPDHVIEGGKITSVAGFDLAHGAVSALIAGKNVAVAAGDVQTLTARKAALLTIDKNGVRGKVEATYPTTLIDNNTVGMWIFNQPAGSPVPNSAVGVSSIAVANDLTPAGTMTRVDGRFDYAIKGDGSTGYYTSANYTGFPLGAAERELVCLFTLNKSASIRQVVASYGVPSNNNVFGLQTNNSSLSLYNFNGDPIFDYAPSVGGVYLASVQYTGSDIFLFINGVLVSKLSGTYTLNTLAGAMKVMNDSGLFADVTIHYVELRNKCRTPQQIAEIAAKLLFPVSWDYYALAQYPPAAGALVEYKMDEAGGNLVDTGANLQNATVTGTTVVPSRYGLGNARRFTAATDKAVVASVTNLSTTAVTIEAEVYLPKIPSAQAAIASLFSHANPINFAIHSTGAVILNNNAGAQVTGTKSVPIGKPFIITLTYASSLASVYIDGEFLESLSWVTTLAGSGLSIGLLQDGATWPLGANCPGAEIGQFRLWNTALTAEQIRQRYYLNIKTARKNITSILPADTIALGYAYAGSSGITEFNDSDWGYGRREKAVSGNRRVFLGWKYFSGGTVLSWNNPFGSRKVRLKYSFAQNAEGMNESDTYSYFYTTTDFGIRSWPSTSNAIRAQVYGAVLNGVSVTSGYIGCYAEVLEDD